MDYVKLYQKLLTFWSSVPTNPEYSDLVAGGSEFAPLAAANALEITLVVAGFRPAMLVDAADFHPTSVYGPVGRAWMKILTNQILEILPPFMKTYDDFIPDDTVDIGGTGIFFYNSKLLKEADFSAQSVGRILQYDCDGDLGGEYSVSLYLRNEEHQQINVIQQMCNAIERRLPHLVKRLNDLSRVIKKTGLPFGSPGLAIEKR